LLQETRQDVKEMKESVASIDKNVAVLIEAFKAEKERRDTMEETISTNKTKIESLEKHVDMEKTIYKVLGVIGIIILFFIEVVPFVQSLLK
jgi:peptidoglycan hydrolase CwlO-like protein